MVQVVEHLSSNHKALNPNPSIATITKRKYLQFGWACDRYGSRLCHPSYKGSVNRRLVVQVG
jgi:hypothetical protein